MIARAPRVISPIRVAGTPMGQGIVGQTQRLDDILQQNLARMDIGGRSSVIVYLLYLPKYYGLERRPNVRFRKLSPLRIRASIRPRQAYRESS